MTTATPPPRRLHAFTSLLYRQPRTKRSLVTVVMVVELGIVAQDSGNEERERRWGGEGGRVIVVW
ncbi:hypothetical protein E2C01_019402 [Portunus trituberculatus]|uniref:Uncharacterized protein n=1 Tax=Portunus trituberculatus TaxID=210409 RepID=A0A5B7DZ94_PORTR|nr:hypothetical protein [Portunus trituberculatus]